MPYPEFFVAPMRQELLDRGVRELRTPEEVDAAVAGIHRTAARRRARLHARRSAIESRDALTIAEMLTAAFDEYCATPVRT